MMKVTKEQVREWLHETLDTVLGLPVTGPYGDDCTLQCFGCDDIDAAELIEAAEQHFGRPNLIAGSTLDLPYYYDELTVGNIFALLVTEEA